MLSSISPVGEASRHQQWSITVTAYTFASALGGTLVGAALGTLGSILGAASWGGWRGLGLAAALVAGAAIDAGRLPIALPSWRRQVDERWLTTYRGWVYGAGYGFQLGTAVVTIITSAITYAALLAALLTGSPGHGALVGVTFGLVRAVPLLLSGRIRTPRQLQDVHRRIDAATSTVTTGAVAAQLGLAVVAVGLGLSAVAA